MFLHKARLIYMEKLASNQEASASILLEKGWHSFRIYWKVEPTGSPLEVSYSGPSIGRTPLKDAAVASSNESIKETPRSAKE